jgi:hypothetical protein
VPSPPSIDEHPDVAPGHVLDAPMPPRRQHFILEDASLLGPAALLLGGLLVQLVERADGVAVGRAFVVLLGSRVRAIQDGPARIQRLLARPGEITIRIAPERQPAKASVVPVQRTHDL